MLVTAVTCRSAKVFLLCNLTHKIAGQFWVGLMRVVGGQYSELGSGIKIMSSLEYPTMFVVKYFNLYTDVCKAPYSVLSAGYSGGI